MAVRARSWATYEDPERVPDHLFGELVDGELYVSPRPRLGDGMIAAFLMSTLGPPFSYGDGGPGGWLIVPEPELRLRGDAPVPDVAAWRLERAPRDLDVVGNDIPPDWVCEICSPTTRLYDRQIKMPKYAANGVAFAWIIDRRMLAVYRLETAAWVKLATHGEEDVVRVEPFDAIEIDLRRIFAAPQRQ